MTILNIILGIVVIIIIVSLIRLFTSKNENVKEMSVFNFVVFSSIYIGMIIPMVYLWTTPKAIDVYRNKTTLEITYKDNVPIDSVVVWKEAEK